MNEHIEKIKELLNYSHTEPAGTLDDIPMYKMIDNEGNEISAEKYLLVVSTVADMKDL